MATQNKTRPTNLDVNAYLASLLPEARRDDCLLLNTLMKDVTGWRPVIWGDSLVGYGSYHYRYASGREGDFFVTGFAARKQGISVYIMPGYRDFSHHLAALGPHSMGKSCLTLKRLGDVNLDVLKALVKDGVQYMVEHYQVTGS